MTAVRETACTACIHSKVCTFKKDYLDMIEVLEKRYNEFATINDKAFMAFRDPDCKHLEKKLQVPNFIPGVRGAEAANEMLKERGYTV